MQGVMTLYEIVVGKVKRNRRFEVFHFLTKCQRWD